jgi:hypothetical protein
MNDLERESRLESTETIRRVGAAFDLQDLSPGDAFTPTPTDLPMIVWLLGTEPWFSEFSLEAEQVMISLGIKRTRLTQISGRELRVGRVRRGRYISPVFRPEDVEQYLKWSRAPSTHIKSSTMLSEAADTLRQQADLLESQFLELKDSMTSDFEAGIKRAVLHSEEISAANKGQIQRSFLQFSEQMADRLNMLGRRQDSFSQQLGQLTSTLEKLHAGQMAMLQALQESQVRNSTELTLQTKNLEAALDKVDERIASVAEANNSPRRPNRSFVRAQKMQRPRLATKKMHHVSLLEKESKRVPAVRKRMLRSKA